MYFRFFMKFGSMVTNFFIFWGVKKGLFVFSSKLFHIIFAKNSNLKNQVAVLVF